MKMLTDEEIRFAHLLWKSDYQKLIGNSLSGSRLKQARQQLFLSTEEVGKSLGVSRAAYSKFEEREENETISLKVLREAAEAMGCEFVYEIRPQEGKTFAEVIWQKIFKTASKSPWLKNCDQKKRANALAAVARDLMNDPKFRKAQGWATRRSQT